MGGTDSNRYECPAELKTKFDAQFAGKGGMTESNDFVISIAKRYHQRRGLSFQDLAQEGILGSTGACESLTPNVAFAFRRDVVDQTEYSLTFADQRSYHSCSACHDQLNACTKLEQEPHSGAWS
jgi:hypothetical protein